ncbi:Serine/threonine-protein kinase PrkC [Rubripirellula tenax]|uniref:non-specific serine/threonine protein kinase n=1 Tax=Rubripirellula tenax TaxID=2528015 RepID=A0A5C6F7M4_9BACT|nr:bifunctional serine/threonine-protein kinase/ABC transporter substrate-binding protein [Rubripirellula tenax]TWU56457.1 Serine/threonine-protein kinase PrkC [Rubripirellula tenax]
MDTKSQHLSDETLAAWLADRLSDEEALSVESHLCDCDDCAKRLDGAMPKSDTLFDQLKVGFDTRIDRPDKQHYEHILKEAEKRIGQTLGRHEITSILGLGGMGVVFSAKDLTIDRRVAIKVLHADFSDSPQRLGRFLAEARAVGKLSHPNVLAIFDAAEENGSHYLVMEFATGGSVADRLQRQGSLPPKEARDVVRQAAVGLSAAHDSGLIHRDLKPANLLIADGEVIKIADFGIAKRIDDDNLGLTREGQLLGTPHYMSPEQCAGKLVDNRSDIYSLGATYYSLLTGRTPYFARDTLASIVHAHCHEPPPNPREVVPTTPAYAADVIRRAMAIDPEDRYQSLESMIADLDSRNVSRKSNRQIPITKIPRRVLIGGGAAIAFGAAASYFWPHTGAVSGDAIRVGILHSLSGTMRQSEESLIDAYHLAITEINEAGGVLGRPVEAAIADGKSNDDTFAEQAARLIDQEQVCTLFGCLTSSSRKTVVPVVEQRNHLLFYPSHHEGLETSPNVVYMGADVSQMTEACVRYAVERQGYSQFYFVGSDYIYPRVALEIADHEVQKYKANLVGHAFLPLGELQVSQIVDDIELKQPDAILNEIVGDSQSAFIRELSRRGIRVTQFAMALDEQQLHFDNANETAENYSAHTYFQSLSRPESAAFIKRFQDQYGSQRYVSGAMESAYAGMHLWATAVNKAESTKATSIRDAIAGIEFLAPSGPLSIDSATFYARRRLLIGRVSGDGVFEIEYESPKPLQPQPYPKWRTKEQWDELTHGWYQTWGNRWSAPTNAVITIGP